MCVNRQLLNRPTLELLVERVSDLSAAHVDSGGLPFGALVVDQRATVIASGFNRVREDSDPTAHAEIVACREAAKRLGSWSLSGATLIASGEPCAMCYVVARLAGVERIVFAVGRDEAAQGGFDYRQSYELLSVDPLQWPLPVEQLRTANAWRPFERFRARHAADSGWGGLEGGSTKPLASR